MVGTVAADFREHLMLLLMALWREDAGFLTDVTLMMTGAADRSDLDVSKLQAEIGEVMAKYRTVALAEMQIGPILQEMSQIALRHRLPLPASLTLSAKRSRSYSLRRRTSIRNSIPSKWLGSSWCDRH
jgi:ubiquinone biosynthesis protein